jgi:hypothetical protein
LMKDQHLQSLNSRILKEQDQTKKLQLELEKRKYLQEQYDQKEMQRATVMRQLHILFASEQFLVTQNVFQNLSQLQNSRYRTQVLIGKAAAIALIVATTPIAAHATYTALALIPFIGPFIAPLAAALVLLFGAEQIGNIIGVDLYSSGVISFGGMFLSPWEILTDKAKFDLIYTAFRNNTIKEFIYGLFPGARILNHFTQIIDDLADKIGDVLEGVGETVVDAVGDVVDFFNPFAEGGLVQTDSNQQTVVTPLRKTPIPFGNEINVRILGGLKAGEGEARELALIIHRAALTMNSRRG